jgi:hypothetical protein
MGDAEYLAAFPLSLHPHAYCQASLGGPVTGPPMGDAEYLAAFGSILMPIAR